MMKKIAVAVSAALLAGSAFAANVTLYGRADTGLAYTQSRAKVVTSSGTATTTTKSFSMDSGNSTGSRWGLKGTEELGNGLKVGFVLESGFGSDTGKGDDKLFNREATLWLSGSFGTVYAGRMGTLIGDAGSTGWWGAMASPFGSGWGEIAGHQAVMNTYASRVDNAIAYFSPRFAGLQFSAQYAMGDDGSENKPSTDRYAAIGADYQMGNLEVGLLVDYVNRNSSGGVEVDDGWTVNLAANYDFGVLKAFAAAQYMKDVNYFGGRTIVLDGNDDYIRQNAFKGFGVNLGVDVPVAGGSLMASAGYGKADGDNAGTKVADMKAYTALVGYSYPFSKRTSVYAGAGLTKLEGDFSAKDEKYTTFQAMCGLVHKF